LKNWDVNDESPLGEVSAADPLKGQDFRENRWAGVNYWAKPLLSKKFGEMGKWEDSCRVRENGEKTRVGYAPR
jgi:hypothetical protein